MIIHDNAADYNAKRNNMSYPAIPLHAQFFFDGWKYTKARDIHGWEWSDTFGKWQALVTFANGQRIWAYPANS